MTRAVARSLVLVGGFLGAAVTASAQELGLGPTYGFTSLGDVGGGPGLQGWVSFDLLSAVRFQGSVAREWGRETERRPFCSFTSLEGGGPDDCITEDVRSFTTITTADVSALLLSPRLLGTRMGLGASYGVHRFEIGQQGLETGRIQVPAEGRNRTVGGRGLLVLVEHRFAGMPASLRGTYHRYRVDFGYCIMDTWSVCGEESFGRFTVGLGYRIF